MTRSNSKRRRFFDIWDAIAQFLDNQYPNSLMDLLEEFVNTIIHVDACLRFDKDPFKARSIGSNNFNGKRTKLLRTAEGDLNLQIPKMRKGSYFPEFLERWDKVSVGFRSIIVNAYYNGVSTRHMKRLFSDLGMDDIDKSMVSRLAAIIEERIDKWLQKPLQEAYSCVWLDAIYTKALKDSYGERERVFSKSVAVLIAMAVDPNGNSEVLHFKICDSESKTNWLSFLMELREKGLQSSELWISDDHKGLEQALMRVYTGQLHQRCLVHWQRNLKDMLSKERQIRYMPLASKTVCSRSIAEFDEYYDSLLMLAIEDKDERLENFLSKSRVEITTYQMFPPEYWSKLKCTNAIERLNKELRAREKPITLFTTLTSLKQLYGYILMTQDLAWKKGGKYLLAPQDETDVLSYIRNYRSGPNSSIRLCNVV